MNPVFIASGAVLAASLFFGGGARRDVIGDLLPVVLACGLIVICLPHALERLREDRLFSFLLAALLIILVAQFVPLPPTIWGALPGRREFIEMYAQSGVAAPWSSLALSQVDAARSALSVLPGVALCLAVPSLDTSERKALIFMVVGFALLNPPLGMLQLLGGTSSPLYLYNVTNVGSAVGFFANRNHFASLLFCALPFVAASLASREEQAGVPLWIAGAVCAGVLFLGLSVSGSRTALILGAVAVIASLAYVARAQVGELMKRRYALAAVGGFIALMIPLALGVGLLTIVERIEGQDLSEDGRWTFAQVTLAAAKDFFPVGAGLGSFQQIYQLREPANTVISPIINHAHNDWLELALELGLPGLLGALAFVGWLGVKLYRHAGGHGVEERMARAGLVALVLLTIHSLWDYPLRTIALMALFGLSCGMTFRPIAERVRQSRAEGRRSRRRRRSRSRSAAAEAAS